MRFKGFDDMEHTLSITDFMIYDDDEKSVSEPHTRARKILKALFPCDKILEEVTLPGSRKNGSVLYADFFIPKKMLMVEVHGRQHYEYVPFFHVNKLGFVKSKLRDSLSKFTDTIFTSKPKPEILAVSAKAFEENITDTMTSDKTREMFLKNDFI